MASAARFIYTQEVSATFARATRPSVQNDGGSGHRRLDDDDGNDDEEEEHDREEHNSGSEDSGDDDDEEEEESAQDGSTAWLQQQRWRSGKQATDGVKAFAQEKGFSVKVDPKSKGGSSKAFVCTSAGCEYRLQTRKLADGDWHVSKSVGEHVTCTSQSKLTALTVSKLASVRTAITARRDISGKELVDLVQASLSSYCQFGKQ